jgi:Uma2 family endonuclease
VVEPLIDIPPGGWTVDDLDKLPVDNYRYELTDGVFSVSPSPSALHQKITGRLFGRLDSAVPEQFTVAMGVEIRFTRQLTRIPDLMVVRSDDPDRHWFAPAEVVLAIEIESPGNHVDDRTTKPAIYAQFGLPHYWRIEPVPLRATTYRLGHGERYVEVHRGDRLTAKEPFDFEVALTDLMSPWKPRP